MSDTAARGAGRPAQYHEMLKSKTRYLLCARMLLCNTMLFRYFKTCVVLFIVQCKAARHSVRVSLILLIGTATWKAVALSAFFILVLLQEAKICLDGDT